MANRRFGNQGPPQRGNAVNRNFGVPAPPNISPWQGGAPPGAPANNQNIQNQLALALTNLIQQSTQPPSNDGPPSLLNLNTSPGFFNQDHYSNPNQQRFPGGNRRQDFRRNEPYNNTKNRMSGWRSDLNNRNRGSNNYSQKKDFVSRDNQKGGQRSAPRDFPKKLNDKPPSKQDKPADAANGSNAEAANKKEQESAAPTTSIAIDDGGAKDSGPKAPTKYDNIPNGLLHCCVCNKSMWDGESFQNHIGGKAHKQMINSLEESFQITVNILRENMRLTEERKVIEFERMKRSRRYHQHNQNEPESHCNMCDLKFMGKIVLHRQSEGHQRLKRFLHPKCNKCHLEFTSRMEWVDHIFMPEHLLKVKDFLESKNTDYGEYKLTMKVDIDNDPLLEENMQNEDDNAILELTDDLTNLFNRIPVFKHERAVAKSALKPATGFVCDMCKMFMVTPEAAEDHNKSFKHYTKFVETIKAMYQRAANEKKKVDDAAAAADEDGAKKPTADGTTADVPTSTEITDVDEEEEPSSENGNGLSKRDLEEDADAVMNEILDETTTTNKEEAPQLTAVEETKVVQEVTEVPNSSPITHKTRRAVANVRNGPAASKRGRF